MIETILVQLMVLYVAGIVTSLSLGAFHFFASSRRAGALLVLSAPLSFSSVFVFVFAVKRHGDWLLADLK